MCLRMEEIYIKENSMSRKLLFSMKQINILYRLATQGVVQGLSFNFTWDLVGNAESQPPPNPPRPTESEYVF